MTYAKEDVDDFWDAAAHGEQCCALEPDEAARFDTRAQARDRIEPYLWAFARFEDGGDKDVREIGAGMGADHIEWAHVRPGSLAGVDLTVRAIHFTRTRFAVAGFAPDLRVADADSLPFKDAFFDLVYIWDALRCSPETANAFREVGRVLRPGGVARVDNRWSLTGLMSGSAAANSEADRRPRLTISMRSIWRAPAPKHTRRPLRRRSAAKLVWSFR
jgi:SAM-dependent methyltransferase